MIGSLVYLLHVEYLRVGIIWCRCLQTNFTSSKLHTVVGHYQHLCEFQIVDATPAEHSDTQCPKIFFFFRIPYLRKSLFALVGQNFSQRKLLLRGNLNICYCTIFYISRDHYAEPKQCFGSYVMTKKNAFCIHLISLSFTGLLCQYTKKLFETFFEIHYYTFKCICCTQYYYNASIIIILIVLLHKCKKYI